MLTDVAARKAKGAEKPYKLSDSQGLFLYVQPNGSRLWRMKYRFGGKERLLSFGKYPEVSLSSARQARDDARAELREGRDPSLTRKQRRAKAYKTDDHFRRVSEEWLEHNKSRWVKKHCADVHGSLERHVWPSLGAIPLNSITPPMLLEVLRTIEKTSANETAHRVRQRISAIFDYGIANGLAVSNPAPQLKSLLSPVRKGKQPAITDLSRLRHMLNAIENFPAHPVTLLAMRFLALTAVRSNEVRGMRWEEVKDNVWTIPEGRMKMRRDHVVPLSSQARAILEVIRPLTGKSPFVFPSVRWPHKPMSENTLSALIKRAGYEGQHVPHGFRSSFSTIMNEKRPEDRSTIDMMLAHVPKNSVEAAYNRAQHLEKRQEIAQEWADLLLRDAKPTSSILQVRRH
ncbi:MULTISPECIES: phage integrase central domain-containing protein [unclassified Saccharibacter]|uniref:tyrosine-type recombinase/integrase n=1 Tax=unclassified Saccharibacter TaxID=2648722 RepID=UPI0013293F43|nr:MULTISPECIES: integrase arm-type DNA-binding domain-containing protein [unclassified Saccharibacter]MXV35930.1 tyrosine-type recombinase/integrase [Saccharibacter sp. EH611]MXV58050.1 tyrosine-type recombinase/integrase [Saccharibacter sp. EH70]MXV66288.1 tyrosine-type recombinase/integrase [Saccharibacter sp. EH60]